MARLDNRNWYASLSVLSEMFVDLLQWLQPIRGLSVWGRYALTVVVVLLFFAIRWWADSVFSGYRFSFFFLPVIFCSLLLGRRSGLLATFLSAGLVLYFFVEPRFSFNVAQSADVIAISLFLFIAILFASLVEALRRAVGQLARRSQELEEANRKLTASDAQKELLLRDINHRVKNHLASVAGLLRMSRRNVQDENAAEALEEAARRLGVMAKVYDRLHLEGQGTVVDAKSFIEHLMHRPQDDDCRRSSHHVRGGCREHRSRIKSGRDYRLDYQRTSEQHDQVRLP